MSYQPAIDCLAKPLRTINFLQWPKIKQIQSLVRYGLYYLTEHADEEAIEDRLTIYDVEYGLLTGKIRRTWPVDGKYEVVGEALDGRLIGVVCRITKGNKICVITVYEDKP